MSHHRYFAAAAAAAIVIAGCGRTRTAGPVTTRGPKGTDVSPSGTSAADQGKSIVRLVNALPDQRPIALWADDSSVFAGVGAKDVTPYKEIPQNIVNFKLRSPDSTIATNHETMADGARYTLVALPAEDGSGARLRVLRDEVVPDAGKARIRLINATPADHKVDLAVQGSRDAMFSGVHRGTEAGYKDIDPRTATFEIRSDRGGPKPVVIKDWQIQAGRAYTIVLVGGKHGGLEAITFDDTAARSTLSQR